MAMTAMMLLREKNKNCYNQLTVCCGSAIAALAGAVAVQQDSDSSEVNWKRVLGIQQWWH